MARAQPLDVPRRGAPRIVTAPRTTYLTLSGRGLPGTRGSDFQAAIAALYGLAYTMKFRRPKDRRAPLDVGHIAADWWVPGRLDPRRAPKGRWRWQLFLPVPGATKRELAAAAGALEQRGRSGPLTAQVALLTEPKRTFAEVLHVGPYEAEGPSIDLLVEHVRDAGLALTGHHREIYLNDPRRSGPAKAKTLLRHPVTRA